VRDALRERRIDGQDNPLPTIVSTKFYEHQRFLTLTAHTYTPQILVANPDVLASLGDGRAIVEKAAERAIAWQRDAAAKFDADALAELRRHLKVTTLDDAERETFVRATAPVYERAADLVGEAELVALRNAARAAESGLPGKISGWS
jgi:TRAP-type C4-dicarboxylate transport system substrate-binding protein